MNGTEVVPIAGAFANVIIGPVSQDMCRLTLGYMMGTFAVWKLVFALGFVMTLSSTVVSVVTEWAKAKFRRRYR